MAADVAPVASSPGAPDALLGAGACLPSHELVSAGWADRRHTDGASTRTVNGLSPPPGTPSTKSDLEPTKSRKRRRSASGAAQPSKRAMVANPTADHREVYVYGVAGGVVPDWWEPLLGGGGAATVFERVDHTRINVEDSEEPAGPRASDLRYFASLRRESAKLDPLVGLTIVFDLNHPTRATVAAICGFTSVDALNMFLDTQANLVFDPLASGVLGPSPLDGPSTKPRPRAISYVDTLRGLAGMKKSSAFQRVVDRVLGLDAPVAVKLRSSEFSSVAACDSPQHDPISIEHTTVLAVLQLLSFASVDFDRRGPPRWRRVPGPDAPGMYWGYSADQVFQGMLVLSCFLDRRRGSSKGAKVRKDLTYRYFVDERPSVPQHDPVALAAAEIGNIPARVLLDRSRLRADLSAILRERDLDYQPHTVERSSLDVVRLLCSHRRDAGLDQLLRTSTELHTRRLLARHGLTPSDLDLGGRDRHASADLHQGAVDMEVTVLLGAALSGAPAQVFCPRRALGKLGVPEAEWRSIDWTVGLSSKLFLPRVEPPYHVLLHQLADADAIEATMDTPIPASILAASVGLGKTLTVILVMVMRAMRARRLAAASQLVDARPALVLLPANLVAQFFSELQRFAGGFLVPVVFFGDDRAAAADVAFSRAVVDVSAFRRHMKERSEGEALAENASYVYLSSYHTMVARCFSGSERLVRKGSPEAISPWTTDVVDDPGQPALQDPVRLQPGPDTVAIKSYRLRLVDGAPGSRPPTFGLMVLDEAHYISNPHSIAGRLCSCIRKTSLVLITATPMLGGFPGVVGNNHLLRSVAVPLGSCAREDPWLARRQALDAIGPGGTPCSLDTVRYLYDTFVIRRTPTTGIVNPNGGDPHVIYPRQDLTPFSCKTEYLCYPQGSRDEVSAITMQLAKAAGTAPPPDDGGPTIAALGSGGHRAAQLLAMDRKVYNMITRADGAAGSALKTRDVDRLASLDPDRGLRQYVAGSIGHSQVPPSADDARAMVSYCTADSPALFRTLQVVLENRELGKRTLIVALLHRASLDVLDVRARHHDNERARVYAAFTDPNRPVDCLVLNLAVSAAGLNLQGACTEGLVVMEGWSRPLTLQAFGRLWRIGQGGAVTFRMLHVPGTYYDVLEDKSNRKYVEQLRVEATMPARFRSAFLQRLYAYELIAQQFGQGFSRMAWVVLMPVHITDMHRPGMKAAAAFLTSLLLALLAMPEADFPGPGPDHVRRELERDIQHLAVRASLYFGANPQAPLGPVSLASLRGYARMGERYGRARAPFWDSASYATSEREEEWISQQPAAVSATAWRQIQRVVDKDADKQVDRILRTLRDANPDADVPEVENSSARGCSPDLASKARLEPVPDQSRHAQEVPSPAARHPPDSVIPQPAPGPVSVWSTSLDSPWLLGIQSWTKARRPSVYSSSPALYV